MPADEPPNKSQIVLKKLVNANTILPGRGVLGTDFERSDLRASYAIAERAASAATDTFDGHRLYWVNGANVSYAALPASSDAHLVVGRHTNCDVVLPLDPSIALRHLVVRSMRMPDGDLALRVLDLHTQIGFKLENGESRHSIVARGPIALHLGRYSFIAIPSAAPTPRELPEVVVEQMAGPYRSPGMRDRRSSIGILPRITDVFDREVRAMGANDTDVFSIENKTRSETIAVSDQALELGVVVGRSAKAGAQISALMDAGVSRLHLLLLREMGQTYALDLRSVNGTYDWVGQRIRRVCLSEGDVVLRLGAKREVVFRFHARIRP
jgi:hypothetical protein